MDKTYCLVGVDGTRKFHDFRRKVAQVVEAVVKTTKFALQAQIPDCKLVTDRCAPQPILNFDRNRNLLYWRSPAGILPQLLASTVLIECIEKKFGKLGGQFFKAQVLQENSKGERFWDFPYDFMCENHSFKSYDYPDFCQFRGFSKFASPT